MSKCGGAHRCSAASDHEVNETRVSLIRRIHMPNVVCTKVYVVNAHFAEDRLAGVDMQNTLSHL